MFKPLRDKYADWKRNSTGVGILVRQAKRMVRTLAYRKYRVGNIAMLHAGRCGSSVLADLLDQHPDVRWAGELFEEMLPAYYRMNGKNRAYHVIGNSLYERNTKYYGFDSKYLPEQQLNPQLANKTPEEYITLLDSLGFNYFILLDRKNHLRRAISTAIGAKTGLWNSFQSVNEKTTIRLDPKRFVSYGQEMSLIDFFEALDATYLVLKKRLKQHKLLELVYETDLEKNPLVAYHKTCAFLGIEPVNTSVRLVKMNPHPILALVDNYDEIAAALAGTKYEWMLRD